MPPLDAKDFEDGCHRRRSFFKGAIVHLPGYCADSERSSELFEQVGGKDGTEGVWRALSDTGIIHGVNEHTGHVICGDEDEVWVLEEHGFIGGTVWVELPGDVRQLFDEKLRRNWVRIMNPRDLETAMRWAKAKTEQGMTVRIRNIKTDDILMGAILGPLGKSPKQPLLHPRIIPRRPF